jgi:transcriptional regulator with XRE-family HTH domain
MTLLGYSIRILRQARGLSSARLASAAKVSPAYLSLIERGDRYPPEATLLRIAMALKVDVEVLRSLQEGKRAVARSQRINDLAASLKRLADAESDLKQKLG